MLYCRRNSAFRQNATFEPPRGPPGRRQERRRGPPGAPQGGPSEAQEQPRAAKSAQEWPWRVQGRQESQNRSQEAPGGLPEVPRGPSRGAQEAFKNPLERAGTKTREDRTRQEETTEDEDKTSQVKRRPKRQKPAQDKTRQDKGTHDKRRPEGRSVCSDTSLLHYTVPQTYKRSVGSTKAAAT